MNHTYKHILILSVSILLFSISNLFAQSYNLEKIDIELCKILNDDQQIRKKIIKAMQNPSLDMFSIHNEMDSIDANNQIYVSNLLDNHGWLNNLSDSANRAIFLVIDHGGKAFSKKYFRMVKEKANQGIISKSSAAVLEDEILMNANKPQRYGTQAKNDLVYYEKGDSVYNGTESLIYIWPIENPEKVDELRISVGLSPINTYIQELENMYKMKVIWDKNLSVRYFKNKKRSKKSKR